MLAVRIGACALLMLAVAGATPAASSYDGTRPMECAIHSAMICSDPKVCVLGSAQTVGLPSVLKVDVGQRLISGAATGRTIRIAWTNRQGGRLLIGGTETGGGWTMAVAEDSGAMSSAVIVRTGGFLLFGDCSAR